MDDQVAPLAERGFSGKGLTDDADVGTERKRGLAIAPKGDVFLGQHDGAGGAGGMAEEVAAGFQAGKEHRQQGGLAGFPLGREESYLSGGEEAAPEPVDGGRRRLGRV
jgi:hypothetical protein